jgi:hypothetical protein
MGAMVLGIGVLCVLVVVHWDTVRGHVDAWWFLATNRTEVMRPDLALKGQPRDIKVTRDGALHRFRMREMLQLLGNCGGRPVVWRLRHRAASDFGFINPTDGEAATAEVALRVLRENGWTIVEQSFPGECYVLVRHKWPAWPGGRPTGTVR